MAMAAENVSSCRIGISPAMNKTAPAHRPGSSSARTGGIWQQSRHANVLLEPAGRDGDAKLLLINTTSGFGISLVAKRPFLPAIGVAIKFDAIMPAMKKGYRV